MASTTYYVALPFVRTEDGHLVPEQSAAMECSSGAVALSRAAGMARTKAGAVAFGRTGDPESGEFADAVVLAKFGEVPDDMGEL
jgi:hypothetical protein